MQRYADRLRAYCSPQVAAAFAVTLALFVGAFQLRQHTAAYWGCRALWMLLCAIVLSGSFRALLDRQLDGLARACRGGAAATPAAAAVPGQRLKGLPAASASKPRSELPVRGIDRFAAACSDLPPLSPSSHSQARGCPVQVHVGRPGLERAGGGAGAGAGRPGGVPRLLPFSFACLPTGALETLRLVATFAQPGLPSWRLNHCKRSTQAQTTANAAVTPDSFVLEVTTATAKHRIEVRHELPL